jgi:outer membrane protein
MKASMRIYLYIPVLILVAFFQSTRLNAQDNENKPLPSLWTLQLCIDYAKQNNIQINTLRLTKASAEQSLLLSKAARNPDLSGSYTPQLTNSKVANPSGKGFTDHVSTSNSLSLNSSVILLNGNYINNDIKQKKLLLQAAGFDVDAEENNISIQITEAYLAILLARENLTYLQDIVQTSQAQLDRAQVLFKAGSIAKKDFVQLEAQSATDKYNLVTAQNNIRQNLLSLKQLLQLPSGIDINIAQPDSLIATAPVAPLSDAQRAAVAQRPEIKSSQLNTQAALLNLLKAKAGLKPTLSANGALVTGNSTLQEGNYLNQLNDNFYQRIGLSLSIPIFNNRQIKTSIAQSKIGIAQATLDLTNTKTILSQQVEQAYINVQNAQAQYKASVVQLNSNKENYQMATEELRLGSLTTVDYLVQKNLYVQALQAYIQAKYNAAVTVKIYDFYKGDPVKL